MNIHYDQDIDVDTVSEIFAQNHSRPLLLADLLSTDLELRTELILKKEKEKLKREKKTKKKKVECTS